MTELERALVTLGNELEYPQTPDLWPGVRERLGSDRRRVRPQLLAAAALVALAVAIAFAVTPARSAILRFFHLGAATVERVDTLPPAQQRSLVSGLGPALARPTVHVPGSLRVRSYYSRPGLAAALLRYRGKPVLYAVLDGDQMGIAKKFADSETRVEPVALGEFGLWLEGGRHVLQWGSGRVETRLAGNVLLWLRRGKTYRLEGDFLRSQMLDLARQITL